MRRALDPDAPAAVVSSVLPPWLHDQPGADGHPALGDRRLAEAGPELIEAGGSQGGMMRTTDGM